MDELTPSERGELEVLSRMPLTDAGQARLEVLRQKASQSTPASAADELASLRQQLEQARRREQDLRAALAEAQKFMATLPDGIGDVLGEHFAEAPEFWEWHQGAMWAVDDALKRAALRETGTPGDEAGEGERGL